MFELGRLLTFKIETFIISNVFNSVNYFLFYFLLRWINNNSIDNIKRFKIFQLCQTALVREEFVALRKLIRKIDI